MHTQPTATQHTANLITRRSSVALRDALTSQLNPPFHADSSVMLDTAVSRRSLPSACKASALEGWNG